MSVKIAAPESESAAFERLVAAAIAFGFTLVKLSKAGDGLLLCAEFKLTKIIDNGSPAPLDLSDLCPTRRAVEHWDWTRAQPLDDGALIEELPRPDRQCQSCFRSCPHARGAVNMPSNLTDDPQQLASPRTAHAHPDGPDIRKLSTEPMDASELLDLVGDEAEMRTRAGKNG